MRSLAESQRSAQQLHLLTDAVKTNKALKSQLLVVVDSQKNKAKKYEEKAKKANEGAELIMKLLNPEPADDETTHSHSDSTSA